MPIARLLSLALLTAAACARDVHVRYPTPPDQPTGTLVLRLSEAASGVSVAINGRLVVEDVHTSRVVITGAPTGTEDIVMTANGQDKAMRVWIDSDETTTIPLGVPDASPGIWRTLLGAAVTVVVYKLIR